MSTSTMISVTKTESKPHSHIGFSLVTWRRDINVTWIGNARSREASHSCPHMLPMLSKDIFLYFYWTLDPAPQHWKSDDVSISSYLSWLQARQVIVGQFHLAIKIQQSWAQTSFPNGWVNCNQDPILKIGDTLPLPKKFGGPRKKKYFMLEISLLKWKAMKGRECLAHCHCASVFSKPIAMLWSGNLSVPTPDCLYQ